MTRALQYRINNTKITHQTVDGEVVIVNLASGSYHSLQDSGAAIWKMLEEECAVPAILDRLNGRYEGMDRPIEGELQRFLDEMDQQGLISQVEKEWSEGVLAHDPPPSIMYGSAKERFVPPVLNTYTDMQDLLLLDPIHDVDATGWPSKPDPNKANPDPPDAGRRV
jgi:hypothetical protein